MTSVEKQKANYVTAYSQAFVNFLEHNQLPLLVYLQECRWLQQLLQTNLHWLNIWNQMLKKTVIAFFHDHLAAHLATNWILLLTILSQDGNLTLLLAILERIETRLLQSLKITKGNVYTAVPLTSDQLQRITTAISQRIDRQVQLTNLLDYQLLGGVVAEVGQFYFDNSLIFQLKKITNRIG